MDKPVKVNWEELTNKQQKDLIEKGYSITCDDTINTPEDIDNRILKCQVVYYGNENEL